MLLDKFTPFYGQHCETTVIGNLLQHFGLKLSEPMLFGIGEGFSYLYWDSKQMGFPFLGGRCKPDAITENIAKNLNFNLKVSETASRSKAWESVKSKIDMGIPVGLKLDCYYLDYFTQKIHFAGHYVAMYGYDDTFAYLIDTEQQGPAAKTRLESLADARSAKGPMASKNRSFTISMENEPPNLKNVIMIAIHNNAHDYLHPPIENVSFKGIRKTAKVITSWFDRPGVTPDQITLAGTIMEKAGTGGALFRNMYRDFLIECNALYPEMKFEGPIQKFTLIAEKWTEVSRLICKAGDDANAQPLKEASQILLEIATLEEDAMKLLFENTTAFNNES